ncbi:hypothetical protein AGOR_G00057470 [Albula goreensis]|uniref:Zinc finger CCHC domain-containing protein 8 n=1 Tax=Albula goreensis TaxID=1534307 RepID=A0A8T3DZC2_9TELE|nr:hypothetical protein AGOR_G00057470 [Albula goreensis]
MAAHICILVFVIYALGFGAWHVISLTSCAHQDLKRKLNVLARPSGCSVENSKLDGPLLQIIFGNNDISKQCRQEIEDCIYGLVQKHAQEKHEKEKPSFHLKPQPSSFVLEENHKMKNSDPIKKIKDAFSVVGSVLYFTSFCLDKLGQPLLNENPQLTEGWEVPKYQQVFGQVIAAEGQEVLQVKEKRPKPCCFNCGSEDHQLRDCPKPKDMARINEKRKEFTGGSNQSNQRYHEEEVEERFGKYKPGIVSEELLEALGVAENALPPFIYRMRQLGYPPGWLKEAELENSGLMLYDGRVSSEGEITEDENFQSHTISYDVSKLVNFPGFNVSAPANVNDEWRSYGSIPMQTDQLKKNFAAYLSTNYPTPGSNCNKRAHEPDSTPRHTKKRRSDHDSSRCSDMEVDSGSETPRSSQSSDHFQFHPPLPPGTLPRPHPPTGPRRCGGGGVEELGEEDGLTLEELEEQQRLIWAALESADTATNSDSETPAAGTPLISSSGASSPTHVDTETEMEAEEEERAEKSEVSEEASSSNGEEQGRQAGTTGDDTTMEGAPQPLQQGGAQPAPETGSQGVETDPGSQEAEAPAAGQAGKVLSVPHRSKFAAGIIPFEDTPEYKEVAEGTGVFLRIRDLLKCSPRNQAKNKSK